MNKHEKEVVKAQLMSEKQTLRTIQAVYKKALQDVENKLVISNGKINTLLKDVDNLSDEEKSILQSQIYQRKMQRSLKSQLNIMLKDLAVNQYGTINEYLRNSYQNGYIGALYNINMQGMPLILLVDPYLVHRAIEIDSKIKHGLYRNLVGKVDVFKRRIANDISRGIASSASYHDMASWIRHDTKVSVGKSMRIVRTEGNRVYNAATLDCGKGAKERGCDLVKVWDSTLDMKTRPTHRECDGQVRELDEGFKNANGEAKAPGQFGIASEDINCRCAVLIKPRWDVDSRFTKRDNETKELKEFEGVKSYREFKKRYWESVDKSGESGIINNKIRTYNIHSNSNSRVYSTEELESAMCSSPLGSSMSDYIEQEGLSIEMNYDDNAPQNILGWISGKDISINVVNHKDAYDVSQTIVHECAHRRFNWDTTMEDEINCMIYDYLHIHESISQDAIKEIVFFVKSEYSDLPKGVLYGY